MVRLRDFLRRSVLIFPLSFAACTVTPPPAWDGTAASGETVGTNDVKLSLPPELNVARWDVKRAQCAADCRKVKWMDQRVMAVERLTVHGTLDPRSPHRFVFELEETRLEGPLSFSEFKSFLHAQGVKAVGKEVTEKLLIDDAIAGAPCIRREGEAPYGSPDFPKRPLKFVMTSYLCQSAADPKRMYKLEFSEHLDADARPMTAEARRAQLQRLSLS